ncbi:MAG: glycerophosphodiester phosphodiesterase, partial [Thermoguttaceae bacterium]
MQIKSLLIAANIMFIASNCFSTEAYPKIPKNRVVAHRGNSIIAPENTLASCRAAVDAEADGCEFDLRATKDGKIILLHDASLNRTTDITAEVVDGKPKQIPAATLTLDEIQKLDAGKWKNEKYAGEKVPTFRECLAFFKEANSSVKTNEGQKKCTLVIEIKEPEIEQQVLDEINEAGIHEQCVIISFSKETVKKIRKLDPHMPVAWLWGEEWKGTEDELADMLINTARELDTKLLDLNYGKLTENVIQKLKQSGITV